MNLMANLFLGEVSLTEQSSGSAMNIVDQEVVDLPEETSMLLWDPDLSMPFCDLFEVQEPLAEVLAVKMFNRVQPVSNKLIISHTSRGKQMFDLLKEFVVYQINPINIHTQESPKLDYNIVQDLKKLKERNREEDYIFYHE